MIDSGASQSFINLSLVRKLGIPLVPLQEHIFIDVADGRPIDSGAITHKTCPTSMIVGKHHEEIQFFVTNIGHHNIILGTPWLKKHNPQIHWPKSTIDFNSDFCQARCTAQSSGLRADTRRHQSIMTSTNRHGKYHSSQETPQS
jgi:hypothetical protein